MLKGMVSLVIPILDNKQVRERRGYLQQCVASIKEQTYTNYEILEVRSDASVAINCNAGLKRARGEFFKEIGDDDWLPPNSLADLVGGMEGHDWIVANSINVMSDERTEEIIPIERLNLKDMANHNVIHNGGTMYRTELVRDMGGMDESLWTAEEYEFHLRLMKNGYFPGYVNKFVYYYRVHRDQKSRQLRMKNKQKREDEIRRIQALYSDAV